MDKQREARKADDSSGNNAKAGKLEFLITSMVTLCPILIGLLLWNKLPDEMAVRFSMNGDKLGYSSKGFAVFGIPIMMFVCHLFCIVPLMIDPKNNKISRILMLLLLWIVPVLSLLLNGGLFLYALL